MATDLHAHSNQGQHLSHFLGSGFRQVASPHFGTMEGISALIRRMKPPVLHMQISHPSSYIPTCTLSADGQTSVDVESNSSTSEPLTNPTTRGSYSTSIQQCGPVVFYQCLCYLCDRLRSPAQHGNTRDVRHSELRHLTYQTDSRSMLIHRSGIGAQKRD